MHAHCHWRNARDRLRDRAGHSSQDGGQRADHRPRPRQRVNRAVASARAAARRSRRASPARRSTCATGRPSSGWSRTTVAPVWRPGHARQQRGRRRLRRRRVDDRRRLGARDRHESDRRLLLHARGACRSSRRRGGGWIINIASLAGRNYFADGAALLRVEGRPDRVQRVADAGSALRQHPRQRRHAGLGGDRVLALAVESDDDWKLSPDDVAEVVMDLLRHPAAACRARSRSGRRRPK